MGTANYAREIHVFFEKSTMRTTVFHRLTIELEKDLQPLKRLVRPFIE